MILALLLNLIIPSAASELAKPHHVAVIDTGFGFASKTPLHGRLCSTGHKDFSGENIYRKYKDIKDLVPSDTHGHGTNIAGIITDQSGPADYCLVIIKFYAERATDKQRVAASVKAIRYANSLGVDLINYSGGGPGKYDEEREEIRKFLDRGGILIAAAGNNHVDLTIGDEDREYYPAMYDKRIIVVGNGTYKDGKMVRTPSSNFGKLVTVWEIGTDIPANGLTLSGTSQATAITTAKYIKSKYMIQGKNDNIR